MSDPSISVNAEWLPIRAYSYLPTLLAHFITDDDELGPITMYHPSFGDQELVVERVSADEFNAYMDGHVDYGYFEEENE